MNQERSQIGIAAFADTQETVTFTAGMLTWYQAKPGGKVSAVLERISVADCSDQSSCGHWAHAFNCVQPLKEFIATKDGIDTLIVFINVPVQFTQARILIGNDLPGQSG
jgi:hypothetical protein